MLGLRVRTLTKLLNTSSLSAHFDQSTRQLRSMIGSDDESRKLKRNRDTQLMKRLQNIALCMYANKVTLMNLHNNPDKNDLLNDNWKDSSTLSTQSKEFIDEMLKKIDDSVLEYKNSLEAENYSSSSDETDSTSSWSSDCSSSDSDDSTSEDSDLEWLLSSDDDLSSSDSESEDDTISDRDEKIMEISKDDFDYKIMMLHGI